MNSYLICDVITVKRKKQIDISFSSIFPVIENEFGHNIV